MPDSVGRPASARRARRHVDRSGPQTAAVFEPIVCDLDDEEQAKLAAINRVIRSRYPKATPGAEDIIRLRLLRAFRETPAAEQEQMVDDINRYLDSLRSLYRRKRDGTYVLRR
jgi:hypothetical protein